MARLLPLFPLQLVVFPGSAVPLHIFEDRYKEMIGAAEASGTEFGIVLAKDSGITERRVHRTRGNRFEALSGWAVRCVGAGPAALRDPVAQSG